MLQNFDFKASLEAFNQQVKEAKARPGFGVPPVAVFSPPKDWLLR